MNKTFYGHTPNVDGLLNLVHSDTHIHNIYRDEISYSGGDF